MVLLAQIYKCNKTFESLNLQSQINVTQIDVHTNSQKKGEFVCMTYYSDIAKRSFDVALRFTIN